MPRDRRGHRDLRRLAIPDLPHHHDVRVLTEERSQGLRESQTRRAIDLDLAGPRQAILHRILQGDDIAGLTVDLREGSEERSALSATGGARRENDTVSPRHHPPKLMQIRASHAEVVQTPGRGIGVQDPHDRLLAAVHRHGAHPEGEVPSLVGQVNTTVLGAPTDGDVHASQHLQARKHRSA
jgi:hypothetical protein